MSRSGVVRLLICLTLIGFVLAGVVGDMALAAQESSQLSVSPSVDQQVDGEDRIELYTAYPAFQDISGETFQFEVELIYEGTQTRTFELSATPIPHWLVSIRSIFHTIFLYQPRRQCFGSSF